MNQLFGGCQFHNNKEAEMVILNGFEYKNILYKDRSFIPSKTCICQGTLWPLSYSGT